MSNPDVSRVWDEATKILAYVVTSAADYGVTLPTRQFVTLGEAVHDCEQVAVALRLVQTGLPNSQQTDPAGIGEYFACAPTWTGVMEVSITRCAPVPGNDGRAPSVTQLANAAEETAKDASLLMNVAALRASEAFGAVAASCAFPPPNGGMQAAVLTISVAIF